jgi:hypothetical protein
MNTGMILNGLIGPAAFLLLCLPALFRPQARRWVLAVVLISLTDSMATLLPLMDKHLQFAGVHWNWSGKIIAIGVMASIALAFIVKRQFQARDFGITLRQAPGTGRALLTVAIPYLILLAVLTATMFGETKPQSAETIWYEATMPGLAEELAWRGVLLALLDRIFTGRFALGKVELGYGAIALSIVFGLVHGVGFDNHFKMQLSVVGGLTAGLTGFLLAWLRTRTKSLVFPILLHNATNVILETVPLMLY